MHARISLDEKGSLDRAHKQHACGLMGVLQQPHDHCSAAYLHVTLMRPGVCEDDFARNLQGKMDEKVRYFER